MKIIAIVPARGGSKGIKNKNLVKYKGKPLIFHTLKILSKIPNIYKFISTDSIKIKNYSEKFGFKINYLRPKKLSNDKSDIVDVVLNALEWLKRKELFFDYILLLQPTSPERSISEIKRWINIIKRKKYNSTTSVVKIPFHPSETINLKKKKWRFLAKNKKKIIRRQDFVNNYHFIDGSFYMCKVDFLIKNKSFIKEGYTHIFKSNISYPIDINNHLDIKIAEAVSKYLK